MRRVETRDQAGQGYGGIPRTERERMTMSSTARGVGETIKDPRIVIEFEVQLSKEINEIIGSPTREGKSKE